MQNLELISQNKVLLNEMTNKHEYTKTLEKLFMYILEYFLKKPNGDVNSFNQSGIIKKENPTDCFNNIFDRAKDAFPDRKETSASIGLLNGLSNKPNYLMLAAKDGENRNIFDSSIHKDTRNAYNQLSNKNLDQDIHFRDKLNENQMFSSGYVSPNPFKYDFNLDSPVRSFNNNYDLFENKSDLILSRKSSTNSFHPRLLLDEHMNVSSVTNQRDDERDDKEYQ